MWLEIIQQAQNIATTGAGIAGLKKLYDLVQPYLAKQLNTHASLIEARKRGELDTKIFNENIEAIKAARDHLPEASFEIKDGKIQLNLPQSQQQAIGFAVAQAERDIKNLSAVIAGSVEELKGVQSASDEKPNDDWFARFIDSARLVSDEQMQSAWSRILAGEVCHPGSFSLRTLDIVRNLSKQEADTFVKLARFAFRIRNEAFVYAPSNRTLKDRYGFGFDELLKLREAGLVVQSDLVKMRVPTKEESPWHLIFQKYCISIERKTDEQSDLTIRTIVLTKAGTELLRLTPAEPPWEYIEELMGMFPENIVEVSYAPIISVQGDEIEIEAPLKAYKKPSSS